MFIKPVCGSFVLFMGLLALIQKLCELVKLLFGCLIVLEILGLFESFLGHSFAWEMLTFKLPHARASLWAIPINLNTMSEGEFLDLTFIMALHLDFSHFSALVLISVVSHIVGVRMLSILSTFLEAFFGTLRDGFRVCLLSGLIISSNNNPISIHSLQLGFRFSLNSSKMVSLTLGF